VAPRPPKLTPRSRRRGAQQILWKLYEPYSSEKRQSAPRSDYETMIVPTDVTV
jgi:hypothetical protein